MTETNSGEGTKYRGMSIRLAPSFKDFVISRLDEMGKFKDFTLDAIENEKKAISDRFDRDTLGLTEEQKNEYFEWNAEDYFMIEDVFTQISLRSFVVILFSYIEDGMNTLCNAEYSDKSRQQRKKGEEDFAVKYTDMQGKGITRAKLYLEKVIGCNLRSETKPWSEIETLRKIRNAIVHEDGNASDNLVNDGNFKQHINNGRIKLKNHGQIMIDSEYLNYILPQVREYLIGIELK